MSTAPDTFEGWLGLDPSAAQGHLVYRPFHPKTFEPYDIDVEITHTSIDGTDLHVLRSGWFPTAYPVVAGHEFVGRVVRRGDAVTTLSVGDRVGIGGQVGSCLLPTCKPCTHNFEQHCPSMITTYLGYHPNGDRAQGGFATHWRGDARFAIPIPDALPSCEAAPMLCGGITAFAPLSRHGVSKTTRVGVIGIGGVGHFALLWAKALGAGKILAISRTSGKRGDAVKLGAGEFIATSENSDWESRYANSLDLVINTAPSHEMPFQSFLNLLDVGGEFVQIGGPEEGLPAWNAIPLVLKKLTISGSFLGSRQQMREMLELAAEKQVHPWVEERAMTEINQALVDFDKGKAKYRIVLRP